MASASSDPDNIIADAKIEYELKSFVVMGQCYDVVDSEAAERPADPARRHAVGHAGHAKFRLLSVASAARSLED